MTSLPHRAKLLQHALRQVPRCAARRSGYCQRQSKLSGDQFTTTVVLGWAMHPAASLQQLANVTALLGTTISPQGLAARLQAPASVALLGEVLRAILARQLPGAESTVPILQRFSAVTVLDSTTVVLPDALGDVWAGCGGNSPRNTQAALKIGVGMDLRTGQLVAPSVTAGRTQDRSLPVQHAAVLPNSLRIADQGFWSLRRLRTICEQDGHFVSYLHVQAVLLDPESGARIDLMTWLDDAANHDQVRERNVLLGVTTRLPVRLIAIRQPAEVAERRRHARITRARRKGTPPSHEALRRAGWNLIVTDLGPEQLSDGEAVALLAARWQIELLFKSWKSVQHLAVSRSANPVRRQCEVLAKTIACILLQALLNLGWGKPHHSLTHDLRLVHSYLGAIVIAINDYGALLAILTTLQRALTLTGGVKRRRDRPATFQSLESRPMFA